MVLTMFAFVTLPSMGKTILDVFDTSTTWAIHCNLKNNVNLYQKRSITYLHQINNAEYIKDGHAKGRQRYQCKRCEHHYTVKKRSGEKPPETRQFALDMYLEGLGFRAIGRLLKVSHTAVFDWVKKAGKSIALPVENDPVEVAELDEMHTYVGQKKTTDGFGQPLTASVNVSSPLSVATVRRRRD
jgi:transposase-like protein